MAHTATAVLSRGSGRLQYIMHQCDRCETEILWDEELDVGLGHVLISDEMYCREKYGTALLCDVKGIKNAGFKVLEDETRFATVPKSEDMQAIVNGEDYEWVS